MKPGPAADIGITPSRKGRPSTMAFLGRLLRPHARWIAVAMVLNCLSGMAVSAQTLIPKYLIDDILLPQDLVMAERIRLLVWLCAGYLLVTVVWRMLLWHLGFRIFTRIRENVLQDLRSMFFRHANSLCLRFHGRHQSGELFSYLFGSPLNQVQQFFLQFSSQGPQSAFTIMGILIWVGTWDWIVTVTLFSSASASVFAMARIRKKVKALHEEYQDRERAISGRVADLLRGTRHVKLHAIEDQVERRFEDDIATINTMGARRDIRSHELWMRQETVGYVGFAVLCAVCSWRFLGGHIRVGEVSAYLAAFASLQWPLNSLLQLMNLQGGAQASLERIADVLGTLSTTPEPEAEVKETLPAGDFAIRLQNVSFSYGDAPVIRDFNLEIPYGQKIAFVGPSGSGKSTLTQLILRLYDPAEGRVLIGGANLRNCAGREVRRLFGVVPQDPYFFHATILDNVRLLKPSAGIDEVRAALRRAQVLDFVDELPKGLETMVGEQGMNLSGGQRQRLAIARALLPSPPALVFDEATSALDTISELRIQESFGEILGNKTAIFIAHRLSTVKTCDRIIVLRRGRIEQDGTYAELASRPGLFREMLDQADFAEGTRPSRAPAA